MLFANFLGPMFLWGLPLVAIPLIIHLLSRRQQKRISWGAMRFLKEAITRKRRLWRLTDLLLLLLRMAVFLFFIFALAQPLLPATWLGGATPREVIVVLDQSMSMARKTGGTSLFDLQREKANALLDQLTTRDSVRILLAGETPEWLTPDPIPVSPAAIRALHEQVDALAPAQGGADLIACVREATDLETPKDKSARVIVLFNDRQRFGWRIDEAPLWEATQKRLQQTAIPTNVNVQFLTAEKLETANLSVNRIEVARPFAAINQELNFTAQVQNHGSAPSSATLLAWRAGDQSLGVATIPELAAGASTSVSLAHDFPKAGLAEISCRLEVNDALAGDNEARVLVQVYERLPILVVEEPNPAGPLENDSTFILAALGARKGVGDTGWRSVFEPTVIAPAALAGADLQRFRCVILADPRTVEPAVLDKLDAYVRTGGGLWIALGNRTNPESFNDQFYRGGSGLAPLKLTTPIGDPNNREKFFAVRASSESHPATALLADFQRLDLDRARIYRRHQFDPLSGNDVSALLEVQQGDPIVVERKLERGRVLVQSIPLGVSWSSLPLCQAYVAMLHEWLWYLAEPALPNRNLAVGEAALEAANPKATADLTLPDNRNIELQSAPGPSGPQFRYAATRLPGEYVLKPREKDAAATRFLVQRHPEESDLKILAEPDLQKIRAAKGFQIDSAADALGDNTALVVPKHPLAGWLLTALAFALLGELMLAGWMTQRRNLHLKPASMPGASARA